MRIAVLSDIRGNLAALEAVLADLDESESNLHATVCLGDSIGQFAHPNEVAAMLESRDITTIRGNYEEYILERRMSTGIDYASQADERDDLTAADWTFKNLNEDSRSLLSKLPADSTVEVTRGGAATSRLRESESDATKVRKGFLTNFLVGGFLANLGKTPARLRPRRLLFVHGSPRDSIENLFPNTATSIFQTIAAHTEADVIVHGHTHAQYQRVVGKTAFIGVGSVGWPEVAGRAQYTLLECLNFELAVEFREVKYDPEPEARAVEANNLPLGFAQALREGTAARSRAS